MSSTTSTVTSAQSLTSYTASAPNQQTVIKTGVQYGFYFDQSRCTACMACTVACKGWNNLQPGPTKWLRVLQYETGSFPSLRLNNIFAPCYHCQNPVCVTAAKGAMFKEANYGAVLIDPDQANSPNLRAAWDACPYGSIVFDSDSQTANASKCTMCIDRLTQNMLPICVESCMMRALEFGTVPDLVKKYGTNSQLQDMPDPKTTTPAVYFKPQSPKSVVVPYDVTQALALLGKRDPLPAVYTDPTQVTNVPAGVVGRGNLVMKAATVADLMKATMSDDG